MADFETGLFDSAPRPLELVGVDAIKARKAFDQYDVDHSGFIDKGELRGLLEKVGIHMSQIAFSEYCISIFRKLDLDKSGTLSFDEFTVFYNKVLKSEKQKQKHAAMIQKKFGHLEMQATVKECFDRFDKNKSGTIDLGELKVALEDLDMSLTDSQLQHLTAKVFKAADRDRSGTLDFSEFSRLFDECLANEAILKKYKKKVESRYSKHNAEIEAVFALLDMDDSGAVSMTELVGMLEHCDLDPDDIREMFHKHDKNQDGLITLEEFVDMSYSENLRKKTRALL